MMGRGRVLIGLFAFFLLFVSVFSCAPAAQDEEEEQLEYVVVSGYVDRNAYPVQPAMIVAFYHDEKTGKTIASSSPISTSGRYSLRLVKGKEYSFVVTDATGTPINATYGYRYWVLDDGSVNFTISSTKNLGVQIITAGSIFPIRDDSVQDKNGNVLPDSVEEGGKYVKLPRQEIDTDGDGVVDLIIPEHYAPVNFSYDRNGNGKIDFAEDLDGDGIPEGKEDRNRNGVPDILEDLNGNGIPDYYDNPVFLRRVPEQRIDTDGDGTIDLIVPEHYAPANLKLDGNGNGRLDIVEDIDGDGVIEAKEDKNGNGTPDILEDLNGNGIPDYYDRADLQKDGAYSETTTPPDNATTTVAIPIIKSPLVYEDQIHYVLAYSCSECHREGGYSDTIVGGNNFHMFVRPDINWSNPQFLEENIQKSYNELFNPPHPPVTQGYSTFAVRGDPDNSLILKKAANDIDHNPMSVWEKSYRAYQLVYNWLRQGGYYSYYTFTKNAWGVVRNLCYSCHYQQRTCTTDPDTGDVVCTVSKGSAVLAGSRFIVYDGYETCTTDPNGNTVCVPDDMKRTYDSIINNNLVDTSRTYDGADTSPLLQKARGDASHGGGVILSRESNEYKTLRIWIWHGNRYE